MKEKKVYRAYADDHYNDVEYEYEGLATSFEEAAERFVRLEADLSAGTYLHVSSVETGETRWFLVHKTATPITK